MSVETCVQDVPNFGRCVCEYECDCPNSTARTRTMSLNCQNDIENVDGLRSVDETNINGSTIKEKQSISPQLRRRNPCKDKVQDEKNTEGGEPTENGEIVNLQVQNGQSQEGEEEIIIQHVEELGDTAIHLKKTKIQNALVDDISVEVLRQLAISKHGLVTDSFRKQVWLKLVDVDPKNIPEKPDSNILTSHRDYNQVVLDVNRTLKRFPPGMDDKKRLDLQEQLIDVIMRILVLRPELYYYQGYHDICVTLLLVLEEDLTVAVMDKLSTSHLREFLDINMDRTKESLSYLYPIIGKSSLKLRKYMEAAEVGTVFCLPWLITWYGHVLNDLRHILRLYDFFIACQPLMPIYLAVAIVLYREKEVLACECDMPMIHCLLSKIPNDLPYEKLLETAGDLYLMFPPRRLKGEAERWHKQSLVPKPRPREQAIVSKRRPGRHRKKGLLVGAMGWGLAIALSAAAIAAYRNTSDWQWLSSVADWNWWPS